MAEIIANLNKSSRFKRKLLNTPLALTTSVQTFTLSHPITDYDFIVFYTHQTGDFGTISLLSQTRLYTSVNLVTPDYLKTNNNTLQYVYTGSEGKTYSVTVSITYVNDNQIRASLSRARADTYFYVFGIKSELGGAVV